MSMDSPNAIDRTALAASTSACATAPARAA